ncbi:hypothetical protein HY990_00785 [Candidatus Micrarchaeota archaeon]|nr:hypothetical protein [Candidatus Micrarchaeota archaeon]
MYTTSRYSSSSARSFAKKTALENGELYVARGKKTIFRLVFLARKMGEEFIAVVEDGSNESFNISLIKVNPDGGWNWCDTKVK